MIRQKCIVISFHSAVPRKIATGNVALTAASNVLHIHLYVSSLLDQMRYIAGLKIDMLHWL